MSGWDVQSADAELPGKKKKHDISDTEGVGRRGDMTWPSVRAGVVCCSAVVGCIVTSSVFRVQVALDRGSEWPARAVVEVEAVKSWKSLALLTVWWYGIFLSLRAH